MPGDFLSFYQDTALIFTTEKFRHKGIKAAAQGGLASPSMPHHHNEGSIFNLALNIQQGRPVTSLISECQVFD
jgi:hypothetical protein